jgi:MFS family permease
VSTQDNEDKTPSEAGEGKADKADPPPPPWWKEITQPFIDLVHAPRALWGINLGYFLEGMVYFGMLGYLAIHFSDFVFQGIEGADEASHNVVMVLTAGITISMFFLGTIADKRGVRFALIASFLLMIGGRSLMSGAPNILGLEPTRPGVIAGDRISLRVSEVGSRRGNKTILKSSMLANDQGGHDVDSEIAVDLASGPGVEPGAELASHLVKIGRLTLEQGEGQEWAIHYGGGPVKARLIAHAAESIGFCEGATLELARGYVTLRDGVYVIRSHWTEDIKGFDPSGCKKPGVKKSAEVEESALRRATRWSVPKEVPDGGPPVTLADLRDRPDGEVNGVLRNVLVTYVRNGGYFVQETRNGPAIEVFVDPVWSPLHLVTMLGMLLVVLGYGMYQPAAYAGVRQFTTPKTAGMGFAMLYALMNLGGWLPTFAFFLRDKDYLGLGIPGTFWVYTACTVVALVSTWLLLSRSTVEKATAAAKAEAARIEAQEGKTDAKTEDKGQQASPGGAGAAPKKIPAQLWGLLVVMMAALGFKLGNPWGWVGVGVLLLVVLVIFFLPAHLRSKVVGWLADHPLSNSKFFFFIFALIPVQTLFTYNWLVLPQYISRAYAGWIGEYFEIASNANPILIFIAVPMIAALTQKSPVYRMMILGTTVMASSAFLLVIGPKPWTLGAYILLMTIGEAMWQPRFLQYAAEIAPEGRTGEYMGVAQLPWFLTKMLVPFLYSGWMMDRFCPAEGPKHTEIMWLIFGIIAITSPIMLVVARSWVGKDFKTKA